jgi:hypothetical protein
MWLFHRPETSTGDNFGAINLPGQDETAIDSFAIQQHCTRSAIPFLTTVFYVSVTQIAQGLEQRYVGVQGNLMCPAIHVE